MAGEGVKRRLAAILSADVVGYSRLMGEDDTGTLAALKALRKELFAPTVAGHHGRIVKLMGDGALVEFPSVVDAVDCAVAVQQAMAARNADTPGDKRIEFRVGINLGDIIIEGGDIYGDGVNVAARIQEVAEPGGVALSATAHEHAIAKVDVGFTDGGEHELKNIARPVRVYHWSGNADSRSDIADAEDSPLLPDKPSIAVLPFANMSGDPEQEYFSDGITEDIITALSHFKELSVVSRNSSFVFKGKAAALREVHEQLKADYIVEGSIRKAGNTVRITAQLIDAKSDNHIWADRYDRDLADIFEVQDDVVRRVAGTLVGRLEHERQERTKRQTNSQLKAYDLYLRAREHFFNWSIEDNRQARDLLKSAIQIEPDYAAALALYSEALLRMWLNGWSDRPEEELAESFTAAKRADEIDDQDSRTQTALGMAYLFQRELEKAKHHFESALKLNPNDTRVLVYYSRHAVFDGDTERSIELCHQALTLNPFGKYSWNLGVACFVARRYHETIELFETMRNPPETVLAILAASYAMIGDDAKAASTNARFAGAAEASPHLSKLTTNDDWRDYYSARWPFRDREDLEHLMEALGKAGFPV